jgi:beta-N-acetylhexosaminidase
VLGAELRAVNIDMNLAPVMDVDTNPANPVIGADSSSELMCVTIAPTPLRTQEQHACVVWC